MRLPLPSPSGSDARSTVDLSPSSRSSCACKGHPGHPPAGAANERALPAATPVSSAADQHLATGGLGRTRGGVAKPRPASLLPAPALELSTDPRTRAAPSAASRPSGSLASARARRPPILSAEDRRELVSPPRTDDDRPRHFVGWTGDLKRIGPRLRERAAPAPARFARRLSGLPRISGFPGRRSKSRRSTEPLGLLNVTGPARRRLPRSTGSRRGAAPPAASIVGSSARLAAENRNTPDDPDRSSAAGQRAPEPVFC